MKKKIKKLLIVLVIILLPVLFIVYSFTKETIVSPEIDFLRAYQINDKLFLEGRWEIFGVSRRLTSSDFCIKDGKLIIRLYARPSFNTPPYFIVHVPVSKIPDAVYIENETGKLKELSVTPRYSIKKSLGARLGVRVIANRKTSENDSSISFPRLSVTNPERAYKRYDIPEQMIDISFSKPKQFINVPSSYPSIQKAIDAANNGDCIIVAPGHYVGTIALKDGVQVAAKKTGTVSIDGNVGLANNIKLINLTFKNAQIGPSLWSSDKDYYDWDETMEHPTCKEKQKPTFDNVQFLFCTFKGRYLDENNCLLRVRNIANLKVVGCLFSYAKVGDGEMYGVHMQNCKNIKFSSNTIADCYENGHGNIAGLVAEFCSGKISNNLIIDINEDAWQSGYGIWIKEPRGLEVSRNTIRNIYSDAWDSTYGICINGKGTATITHNLIDKLVGEGWTGKVYGIYADTTEPSITFNNVSDLDLTKGDLDDKRKRTIAYFGTGGAKNSTEPPLFFKGSNILSGPKVMLSEGKNSLGAFSGERVQVVIPDGIIVYKSTEEKPSLGIE